MSRLHGAVPVACPILPLLLVIFLVSLAPSQSVAVDFTKSAIVMFEPNVVALPLGVSQCSLDSVSVALSPIETILAARGASLVAAFAPDFEQADTVGTTRLGVEYHITDWSRAFIIELPSEELVDSLVADLQGVPGVVYAEPAAAEVAPTELPYAYPSPCINDPGVSSGVYFCKMTAGTFSDTRKMVIIK